MKSWIITVLLLSAVALNAEEKKGEWLQSRSLTERTASWTQSGSLRSTQATEEDPPTEPPVPIGNGVWYIVAAAGIYCAVRKGKSKFITR
ncbi:MAG: hypothetical protein LBG77_02930 [Dysgonamonadaceae bacterium]|jgi:hypothetical protein|nr:hypothetical protein [Dysgonamonadaceae bacterium]